MKILIFLSWSVFGLRQGELPTPPDDVDSIYDRPEEYFSIRIGSEMRRADWPVSQRNLNLYTKSENKILNQKK